jgi:dihydroorotate dehydrogenase
LRSSHLHAIAAPHSWVKDLTVFLFDLYSGEDAYLKIRAGATLVQLYTAFAYEGPSMLPRIKAELAACLERDGFKSVQDAVGADHHS